jgi:hypothetical protein
VDLKAIVPLAILFGSLLQPSPSAASDTTKPDATVQPGFSADQFDWREVVSYLFDATSLPAEQGIKAVLENSKVMRAYVAREISDCPVNRALCTPTQPADRAGEISRAIDQIVQEGIAHLHNAVYVDYKLVQQPFPFNELAVSKSEKHPEAYFMLALTDHSYTAADVQAKYGAPYDTDIFQWYSVFKYRLDSPRYSSKAFFEIDPTDGAVVKIAISLKTRKVRNK